MEKIQQLIAHQVSTVSSIVVNIEKHIEKLKDTMLSINPDEYQNVITMITVVKSSCEEILQLNLFSTTTLQLLSIMTQIYDLFSQINNNLRNLMTIAINETYIKYVIHNASTTFSLTLYKEKNALITYYEKYQDLDVTTTTEIFDIIFPLVRDVDIAYKFITEDISINKFTIGLIGYVINMSIGERRRKLELIIERQKDNVLGVNSRIDMYATLARYNLAPISHSMSIEKLFENYTWDYDESVSSSDNFNNVATNFGIIIINKITPSPIEFNWRGLLDADYIELHGLKTKLESGLTNKILEKYATMKLLPRGAGPSQFQLKKYGTSNDWYVIESITGDTYRILGRNGQSPISAEYIIGLINGLSMRPHYYNNIHSDIILANYFDPKANLLLQEYADLTIPSVDPIKSAIREELKKSLGVALAAHVPKSVSEFKKMIIDENVIIACVQNKLTYDHRSAEGTLTYITKIDSIIRGITHELERQMKDINLTDRIFSEHSGDELRNVLMTAFVGVVDMTLNEIEKTKILHEYDNTLKKFFLDKKSA